MIKPPFPQFAFEYLASVEANHWWFRGRNAVIIWLLSSKVPNILSFHEVGCGTGFVISAISNAFPKLDLEASEYFEDGLVFAKQRLPHCIFRQLDATSMTVEKTYDCIGSFDVVEHIEDDQSVFFNFIRALKPGGFLLLTVPQHPWLWSQADDYAHHVRRYTAKELRRKLHNAGFQIKYSTSFVSLLLPIMALQRLLLNNKYYNPEEEFKINPLLNSSLYMVMQLELVLLRLGLRFPVGGSLLMLARKP